MVNYFAALIVFILLALIYSIYFKPKIISDPIYFNLNMKDICNSIELDTPNNSKPNEDSYTDEYHEPEEAINYTEARLRHEAKLRREQRLKDNDTDPDYRFSNSDRFLIDNKLETDDDLLTGQMLEMGRRNKEAMTNRAMFSKNSLIPYLEEELQEHENAGGWWDDDDLENEF